jgi:hypothetical protein
MALISSPIPNLINGISQQPAEIRLPTQAERQINGLSSVARGLEKRPGTEHQSRLSTTAENDTFIHSIRRDADEEYTMVLSRTSGAVKTLEIYDKDGGAMPVKSAPTADVSNWPTTTTNNITSANLVYLETPTVKENIIATTVADTTFLINKETIVNKATTNGKVSGEGVTGGWTDALVPTSATGSGLITGAYTHEGLLFVKSGDYSSKYMVSLTITAGGGPYKVGFQTPSSAAGANQSYTSAARIAKILKGGRGECTGAGPSGSIYSSGTTLVAEGWDDFTVTTPAVAVEGFGGWLPTAGRDEGGKESGAGYEGDTYYDGLDAIVAASSNKFAFTQESGTSVIKIQCKEAFTIKVSDSKAGGALVGFTKTTTNFTNLPAVGAPNNYVVKIVGNSDASADDFYVKYNSTDDVWKESLGPGQTLGFDTFTMPHRLIRLYDNTVDKNKYFLYEPVKELPASYGAPARFGWSSRKAGDDDTNPFPSFTGGKINDITFHKNRFGVLSDENIIFSVAGNFYNFLSISVMTFLDSNPVDITVSNNEVSILRHAAAFNQGLLLFSDFQQFNLNSQNAFTPNSVSVDVVTQFESTNKAPPVSSGKFVYFPFKRGEYSGVREYFVDTGSADTNDATDITSHVPQYIKGNITTMVVSSTNDMVAVLSDDDLKRVYIYKNFWEGADKLQNSWSHWTFTGDILNCAFLGSTLKLLVKRYETDGTTVEGLYLEDINLSLDSSEAVMEDDTAVLLDRRVKLVNGNNVAAHLPYFADIPSDMVYVTDNSRKISGSSASATQTLVNEYLAAHSTNVVYAGTPYTFEYEFSRFIHKENQLPVATAKLQIRNINLLYNRTGFFNIKVNVTPGTILIPDPNVIILESCTLTISDATVTVSDTNNLVAGMPVSGRGIPSGTTILSITGGSTTLLELSANALLSDSTITLTFNAGVTISSTPRTNYSKNFSGMITNTSSFGEYKLLSGTFKSSVMTNSSNCNIILENDEYLPCAFMSAEWEGFLHKRNQRVA